MSPKGGRPSYQENDFPFVVRMAKKWCTERTCPEKRSIRALAQEVVNLSPQDVVRLTAADHEKVRSASEETKPRITAEISAKRRSSAVKRLERRFRSLQEEGLVWPLGVVAAIDLFRELEARRLGVEFVRRFTERDRYNPTLMTANTAAFESLTQLSGKSVDELEVYHTQGLVTLRQRIPDKYRDIHI